MMFFAWVVGAGQAWAGPREFEGPLAVEGPANGSTIAKTQSVADDSPAAPQPQRGPASRATDAASSAADEEEPSIPRHRGRGLFVGAGVLGAVAIGGGAALLVGLRPDCVDCKGSPLGLAVTIPSQAARMLVWGAAIGMVAGGAHRRGVHDAHLAADGNQFGKVRSRSIAGGVTLGVSLGLFAANTLARLTTLGRIGKESAQATYTRMAVWSALTDLSMIGTAVGAGLLAHARGYRRERKQLERMVRIGIGFDQGVSLQLHMRF